MSIMNHLFIRKFEVKSISEVFTLLEKFIKPKKIILNDVEYKVNKVYSFSKRKVFVLIKKNSNRVIKLIIDGDNCGTVYGYIDDNNEIVIDRKDGPAEVYISYYTIGYYWMKDGKLHRTDGPAEVHYNMKDKEVFAEKYYINGKKATEFQLTVAKAIEEN